MEIRLVLSAQKGDANAFHQLMNCYKNQLYRIAFRYLKNEPSAMEAIQETTYRAYCNIGKLKKPEYFQTWLIRILINVCQDELKRLKHQIPLTEELRDKQSQRQGDPTEPGGKVNLERLDIFWALQHMDFKYRQVIELKYFEDFTIRDIASILERPEGTIKTWLNQALIQLRRHLAERGGNHV